MGAPDQQPATKLVTERVRHRVPGSTRGDVRAGAPKTRFTTRRREPLGFTGDGGFLYDATELETAARYGINAIIMVNNNVSLSQDVRPFNAAYNGKQHGGFEMWQFSKETDLVKLAESLGCVGIRVDRPGDLKGALSRALSADRPVVMDVRTDINVLAPRAWFGGADVPLRAGAGY